VVELAKRIAMKILTNDDTLIDRSNLTLENVEFALDLYLET